MEFLELVIVILGLFAALILDIWWWNQTRFKKADKKFEAHEHYHISLELLIIAILANYFINPLLAYFVIGASIGFFLGEWDQLKEIKNKKVIPGHPFAYGSSHFKESTIIGIVLIVIVVVLLGIIEGWTV